MMPAIISAVLCLWVLILGLLMWIPLTASPDLMGEQRIRASIDLSLLLWAIAVSFFLHLDWIDWIIRSLSYQLARWIWTLAFVTYLVHMAMAFHYYHGWSHQDAYDRTDRISGFGGGIYVSYLFTLVWLMETMSFWFSINWVMQRPRWVDLLIHGFLAFILFNGSVVYATGPIRWLSLGLFLILTISLFMRWQHQKKQTWILDEFVPR